MLFRTEACQDDWNLSVLSTYGEKADWGNLCADRGRPCNFAGRILGCIVTKTSVEIHSLDRYVLNLSSENRKMFYLSCRLGLSIRLSMTALYVSYILQKQTTQGFGCSGITTNCAILLEVFLWHMEEPHRVSLQLHSCMNKLHYHFFLLRTCCVAVATPSVTLFFNPCRHSVWIKIYTKINSHAQPKDILLCMCMLMDQFMPL